MLNEITLTADEAAILTAVKAAGFTAESVVSGIGYMVAQKTISDLRKQYDAINTDYLARIETVREQAAALDRQRQSDLAAITAEIAAFEKA
jgi:hypothetical protein